MWLSEGIVQSSSCIACAWCPLRFPWNSFGASRLFSRPWATPWLAGWAGKRDCDTYHCFRRHVYLPMEDPWRASSWIHQKAVPKRIFEVDCKHFPKMIFENRLCSSVSRVDKDGPSDAYDTMKKHTVAHSFRPFLVSEKRLIRGWPLAARCRSLLPFRRKFNFKI